MTSPPTQPPPVLPEPAPPEGGAPVAPIVPGAPVVKQTERPHPLSPFIRGWIVFVAIAVSFSRQLIPDGDDGRLDAGDLIGALPFLVGFVLLAGLIGFVSWYFTRFVIDEDELRLETGAAFKSSKRVPFDRVQSVDVSQPLAARMFGLAELRIEVGAGDSSLRLRYLGRARAARLREYLLARASGGRYGLDDSVLASPASAFTDLTAADRPLVTVTPQRLVGSFLLSVEWLVTVGVTVALLVVSNILDVVTYALPGLIPLLFGAVSVVGRRVVAMYRFTLSESPRGLRVTRGLTNLTSQSVPVDRIQAVKISQPRLWRPFGWHRVDVDIVGNVGGDGEGDQSGATGVLLPVASVAEVELALARVLPDADLAAIRLTAVPPRARWVRWFDWWTLRYGWNEQALVTEHGWLVHVRDILPHAKTQSVRIEQGPLQRRLALADVHLDTPRGPVTVIAASLDATAARELALSQLDRARAARRVDRDRVASLRAAPTRDTLLAELGTDGSQLLGSGGESEVYALADPAAVLRLYHARHEAPGQVAEQLQGLYRSWRDADIGLELPVVHTVGRRAGRTYSVDRRFSGIPFSSWLATASPAERRPALLSFLDAATAVSGLPAPLPGFARLVGPDAPRTYPSLLELLNTMLTGPVQRSRDALARDLPEAAAIWDRLQADLGRRVVTPVVVHGDICPPNAYLSLGPQGPVVTGIGDFSPHTVLADPLLDLAGATAFLELEGYAGAVEDAAWLASVAVQRYGTLEVAGGDLSHWLGVYRRFYGFYFSDGCLDQPELYAWCLRALRS